MLKRDKIPVENEGGHDSPSLAEELLATDSYWYRDSQLWLSLAPGKSIMLQWRTTPLRMYGQPNWVWWMLKQKQTTRKPHRAHNIGWVAEGDLEELREEMNVIRCASFIWMMYTQTKHSFNLLKLIYFSILPQYNFAHCLKKSPCYSYQSCRSQ